MKQTEYSRFSRTAFLYATAFCTMLMASVPQANAQGGASGDTVSAIGTTTPVPASPENPSATAQTPPGEFPPQPISVAPTEEDVPVSPTALNPISPEEPATPVPATTIAEPAPSPVIATTPATVVGTAAPVPPSEQTLTPLPQESAGSLEGTNVMGDSGAQQKHSGTYYDADALVPDSDLSAAGATGPRKVDPAYEPGQKYIVVERGAAATSFEGQYVAATRALKLGRYAAAMEMFEKLYGKRHSDPRVLMGLAVAQQGAGFTESAAQTYEELLKVQPNNADAIVNLMGIMRLQYPSVTLKKLMELRNKYPTNAGIAAQLALVNAELKNYDDALRYFEIAASLDQRNASHIYNMAIVADQKGDVSHAIKYYERALQLDASYGDSANSLPREGIYDRLVVLRRKV